MNPLRLAARQRARLPLDGQIAEADFEQVADAIAQLAHHDRRPRRDFGDRLNLVEPRDEVANREPPDSGDRHAVHQHVERLGLELCASACGAGDEAPILRQQNPHVSLVAPPFEPLEEAVHAGPLVFVPLRARTLVAVEQPGALLVGHLAIRRRRADFPAPRQLEHPLVHLAIRRRPPRRDQPVAHRAAVIGNHLVEIELDRAAEAFAFGTRADRTVRRKQRRGRLGKRRGASRAVEAPIEIDRADAVRIAVVALDAHRSRASRAEVECLLERLAHAFDHALAFVVHRDPIDDHHHRAVNRRLRLLRSPVLRLGRNRARRELRRLGDRVVGVNAMVPVLNQVAGRVGNRSRSRLERRQHHVEPRRRQDLRARALDRVAADLAAAFRTYRAPDRREQQPQVVADFGDGADRRARILDRVLLAQRERRRNLGNRIDVRPLHPLQEQPRVSRKTLHVAPLALGINGVEDETRLARSRHSGDDGQLLAGNFERNISQVVSARAPDTD